MPCYEHVFLARQDLANSQVETIASDLTKLIEDAGGKVDKTEYWGIRPLSYRMKKHRKAHYTMLSMTAPPSIILELERTVGLSEDIIRFMTIRVDELEQGQSVMIRKPDRERRERRERRN